jgi:NAD-dependent dihydropyrimidine dehydrogenase PreA subunit
MNIAIHYFSVTGNTLLACRYFSGRSPGRVELFDIAKPERCDPLKYDAVGFAAPTFYFGVPMIVADFLRGMSRQNGKPSFVFHTYGLMPGRTLRHLAQGVAAAGFSVFAGYSLHMPESYPPFIVKGLASADAPSTDELTGFDRFICGVWEKLYSGAWQPGGGFKPRIGLLNAIMPRMSAAKARREMGAPAVDESLCGGCGTCGRVCRYGAVVSSKPAFIPEACAGCWACFNLCPRGAVYTSRMKGIGRYRGPSEELVAKLSPREVK